MSAAAYGAVAQVPTAEGSRYLQQLCKHWSHNLQVEFTPEQGSVVFPHNARGADYPGDGRALFEAGEAVLTVRIEATSAEQLDNLKKVVASHLDRFAFREAPLAFDWQTA
ncbi:DUF2218 domain-containing protein [Sphingomonas sp. PL-96]|uniref:DUF2218 domain-containing protein n=1 Tax=Sphingomonas sp. PL-96 TaxID=2887201 RepID=UPI001E530B08|nr:DUF2218 domain-containing protein [Sphingomonas sp. PL-96]MCC2976358.1 DUF2218 domain-containing protein [Sphingomonas sp. PL-96]